MNHAVYGFIAGFRNRQKLASILRASPRDRETHAISPEALKQSGVTVLALDFDGVLAPHGRPEPVAEITEWLANCCTVFGPDRIYILSNKPTRERIDWFNSRFPGMRFISGVRKKPYPDGLDKVIEQAAATPAEVILLDDRLLTGVLATCLAGTRVAYINRPYTDFRNNPVQELFFAALRTVERILIALVPDKK
ncbi:hypothetical protein OR1_02784 [Geobacter sp. OR-1]|uniref:YqeG family HAD IIIA-type phosphatase n=1 Tax=Geobacter sp. OR-1 TaxID=1266765 RepID=UPI0005431C1E|nr:hypothetical protein [Geobacter sp. OR-1]GAM10495.1 hypothetical protein OR1_02784 [Geobacter sp. OR-1]